MNIYRCLDRQEFNHGEYSIVSLRENDIFPIMELRNKQLSILRQKAPLTREMQRRYYDNVIKPSFSSPHPEQILFSFLFQNKFIGYGGVVHIDWEVKKGEVSYLGKVVHEDNYPAHSHVSDFGCFLAFIKGVAFGCLKLHRLYTETYDIRDYHIFTLESNGFELEVRLKDHVLIDSNYADSLIHSCLRQE